MADRQGTVAGTTGRNARVYYNDGTNYKELQGIGNFEVGDGNVQSNTYNAFEGSFSETGTEEVGPVTFQVTSFMPAHPSWQFMQTQANAGNTVELRVESREKQIAGGLRAGIATTGVVTFNPAWATQTAVPAGVAKGHALKIGSALYIIESISDADAPVVRVSPAPGSAVAQAAATIVFPILRWLITGSISQMPKGSLEADAALTGTFVVQPAARVQLATPVLAHTVA